MPSWPDAPLPQRAITFQLRLRLRPVNRVHGIASSRALGIGLLVNSQTPKSFSLDALERLFDLVNRVLIRGEQAQRKIAVEIVRAGVRRMCRL